MHSSKKDKAKRLTISGLPSPGGVAQPPTSSGVASQLMQALSVSPARPPPASPLSPSSQQQQQHQQQQQQQLQQLQQQQPQSAPAAPALTASSSSLQRASSEGVEPPTGAEAPAPHGSPLQHSQHASPPPTPPPPFQLHSQQQQLQQQIDARAHMEHHRDVLQAQINALQLRFAASEFDGTDARKAAEIELELTTLRAELFRLDNWTASFGDAFADSALTVVAAAGGGGGGGSGSATAGAVTPSLNTSGAIALAQARSGVVARAFGAIIDPHSISEEDFIRIMLAAEERADGRARPDSNDAAAAAAAARAAGNPSRAASMRTRKMSATFIAPTTAAPSSPAPTRPLGTKSTSPTPTMDRHMSQQAHPAAAALSPRQAEAASLVTEHITTLSSATQQLAKVLENSEMRDSKPTQWYNEADEACDVIHMLLKGKRLDGGDRFHKRTLTTLETAQRAVKIALKHSGDGRSSQQVTIVLAALAELLDLLRSLAHAATGVIAPQPFNERALQMASQLRIVRGLAHVDQQPHAIAGALPAAQGASTALAKKKGSAQRRAAVAKAALSMPKPSLSSSGLSSSSRSVPAPPASQQQPSQQLAQRDSQRGKRRSVDDDDSGDLLEGAAGLVGLGVGSTLVLSGDEDEDASPHVDDDERHERDDDDGSDDGSDEASDGDAAGSAEPAAGAGGEAAVAMINFSRDPVTLLDELGRGGSGFVYRAIVGHFTVACKVFFPTTEQEMQLIRREVTTLQQLSHPHVVHMFMTDMTRQNEVRCYMELFSCTLLTIVHERRRGANLPASRRRFTPREITGMLKQVAQALEYIHGLSPPVLHRDLKADNVFAQRVHESDVPLLKLGDFGEARRLPRSERKRLSGNVGTVEFRAPEVTVEQMTRSERHGITYDVQCDIWSFGLVIFELLTLATPYRLERVHPFKMTALIAAGVRPRLPAHVAIAHHDEHVSAAASQQLESLLDMASLASSISGAGGGSGGGGGANVNANGGGGGGSVNGGGSGVASAAINIAGVNSGIKTPADSPDQGSHSDSFADGENELDAEVSAAVAAANRVEYGEFLRLFEHCTMFAPKERPSAKELVKRCRKLEQMQRLQPLNLPAALSRSRQRFSKTHDR